MRIVNHAARPRSLPLVLELGMDAADIFEVRGYPRTERGRLLPIAGTDRRITFRYDGLDGIQRLTHIELSEPAQAIDLVAEVAPDGRNAGAAIHLNWALTLGPDETREVCWTVWTSQRHAPGSDRDEATDRRELDVLFPAAPRVSRDEGASAYHAWERGTTSVESDHELFNLVIKRSVTDLRLLVNDGPGPGERYIAAGVPWFARCSDATR